MTEDDPATQYDAPLIGILACDHVGPELRPAARPRLRRHVHRAAARGRAGDPHTHVRRRRRRAPDHPGECDGWIITGARYGAYRGRPVDRRVAGVHPASPSTAPASSACASGTRSSPALGGRAEPSGTWKAGPQVLHVEPTEWFEGGSVVIHAMHQDVASVVPPGGRTIGSGTTAEHPMYLVGDSILCVQDHPEYGELHRRPGGVAATADG
ncbi:MAG: hypothetical protein R2697_22365 [Ilumatobacteraceae bacterium]